VTARGHKDYVNRINVTRNMTVRANLQRERREHRLKVTTNARGAEVFIDGRNMGRAPVDIDLPEGRHRIRVTARGYKEFNDTVTLNRSRTVHARMVRERREHRLKVTANARGAEVFIDGRNRGRAPVDIDLPEGRHRIKVTARGYRDYNRSVDLNRNQSIHARMVRERREPPPRPRVFSLRVAASVSGAQVFIDGKSAGRAPASARLEAGRHNIKVTARGYQDYVIQVNLTRNTSITARLKPIPPPPPRKFHR
jgi:hypothetical protein